MPVPAIVLLPQCRKNGDWQPVDVVDFIEYACQKYEVDRQQIYLVGYSMGGFGAFSAAAKFPAKFAAIVSIARGGSAEKAVALYQVPIGPFMGQTMLRCL